MTQVDKNKYPAMAKLESNYPKLISVFKELASLFGAKKALSNLANGTLFPEVIAEFIQLLAEHQALLNSVVLLDDDAEPEVGDIVIIQPGNVIQHIISQNDWCAVNAQFGTPERAHPVGSPKLLAGKILTRNFKSVIYKSTLNTVKENGE